MENYNLLLKKFEESIESKYESLIQLNLPSTDKATLWIGVINFSRKLKDNIGEAADKYGLIQSDVDDVIDKVETKMFKKYFDNFKSDEQNDYNQLASDYEDYDVDPLLAEYDEEPWIESEEPILKGQLTESKKKNNSLLIFFMMVLFVGLGYYLFFNVIPQFYQADKSHKASELSTEGGSVKNEADSTLTLSQDGDWFSNNVKINEFRNGEKILEVSSKAEWDKACANKVPAYCHVNYADSNDVKYGLLYNWYALTDERNICPNGYRLPKKSDFEILISDSIEKYRVLNLKKNLPGYRDSDGYFKSFDELLVIWSSEERFSNCIEALVISKNKIKMECYSPSQGYSMRLIKTDK